MESIYEELAQCKKERDKLTQMVRILEELSNADRRMIQQLSLLAENTQASIFSGNSGGAMKQARQLHIAILENRSELLRNCEQRCDRLDERITKLKEQLQ